MQYLTTMSPMWLDMTTGIFHLGCIGPVRTRVVALRCVCNWMLSIKSQSIYAQCHVTGDVDVP